MTPFQALIHTVLQGFDPALALILADACDEREIHNLAAQLRFWATHERISPARLYNTGFPAFYKDVVNLAEIVGVSLEGMQNSTEEWYAKGSTQPSAAPNTCGLRWRGDVRLGANDHPDYRARKDNPNAWRQRSRMGFHRICTRFASHKGDHMDERDLLALVPTPLICRGT